MDTENACALTPDEAKTIRDLDAHLAACARAVANMSLQLERALPAITAELRQVHGSMLHHVGLTSELKGCHGGEGRSGEGCRRGRGCCRSCQAGRRQERRASSRGRHARGRVRRGAHQGQSVRRHRRQGRSSARARCDHRVRRASARMRDPQRARWPPRGLCYSGALIHIRIKSLALTPASSAFLASSSRSSPDKRTCNGFPPVMSLGGRPAPARAPPRVALRARFIAAPRRRGIHATDTPQSARSRLRFARALQ